MRILLIEDDETLCQTIPFQLRQEGFSVDTAMDGEDGLHIARERLHDLILLDRMLPGLDGLASSDSKAWPLQKAPVELDVLLLEVYEAHYPLMKETGLTLTLSLYEQEIPPVKLDKDQIIQVLSILLDNARNLTPAPGKIELELTAHRNRVQIRVSDSGPGVPDREKHKIFERFYRSETSRSDRGHFGLGLSIAAEIVKKHNGRIWVQDATNGGAEFVVELPIS